MALSQSQLLEIAANFAEAFSVINASGEVILDNDENRRRTSSFLISENVPHRNWTAMNLQLTLLELRRQGRLEQRPAPKTRQQVEAERNARDRADGSRQGNAPHNREARAKDTAEELAAAKASFSDAINPQERIRRQEQEKAAAADAQIKLERSIMASLPLDTPYHLMAKEQKREFNKLSAESIKLFLKRQAQHDREHPKVNADE